MERKEQTLRQIDWGRKVRRGRCLNQGGQSSVNRGVWSRTMSGAGWHTGILQCIVGNRLRPTWRTCKNMHWNSGTHNNVDSFGSKLRGNSGQSKAAPTLSVRLPLQSSLFTFQCFFQHFVNQRHFQSLRVQRLKDWFNMIRQFWTGQYLHQSMCVSPFFQMLLYQSDYDLPILSRNTYKCIRGWMKKSKHFFINGAFNLLL